MGFDEGQEHEDLERLVTREEHDDLFRGMGHALAAWRIS